MKKAYHWYVRFDIHETDLKYPHVVVFGGNQINTPLYYHDSKVRTDTPHLIFQYTLSGEGIFRYQNKEHSLTSGKGFLCYSHDPEMAYYYPPEGDQTYENFYCCIEGDPDTLNQIAEMSGRVIELEPENEAIKQFLNYRVRTEYNELIYKPAGEAIQMAACLINNILKTSENTPEHIATSLVSRALVYMKENIEEKFSIKQVAEHFHVTPGHLSKKFKEKMGLTPQKHLEVMRMNHASRLIKSNRLSVKEVAYRMGYDNPPHFIRSFKRVHGVTPGSIK